ncbi:MULTISPECIES: LacI family DNA-binding transcriptional regulator [Piscinibacter]|uniref:LacI family DNA-binding transcriptional regulator n=1 Tax=Piscinibacter TaxID=1114981 RepID=UPI001F0BB148|nr:MULTISPECIES: LacI family DNA-binding transcriptional regulator [Piscinibacter]
MDPKPPKPSRLQMADIARLANVSISTVSRALSNHPRLSEETRQRIHELARSLHYSVDAGAQMMRGKQPPTVAVAFPYHPTERQHFKDPFFLALIGAIGDALIDSGHNMLIEAVQADDFERVAKPYETRQCIGTILLGQEHYHDRINALAVRGIPFVVWGARLKDQLYCSVGSDNTLGGRQATEHLLAHGARRILFLGDPSLPEIAQRHEGWLAAQRAHGIEPEAGLTRPVPFVPQAARAEIERVLADGPAFDAVFAASDRLALAAMAALQARQRRVPQDVQVVGFDDIALSAEANPPLTTVRQDLETAGKTLVERLLAKLAGQAVEPVLLPTTLVVRGSTHGEPESGRPPPA